MILENNFNIEQKKKSKIILSKVVLIPDFFDSDSVNQFFILIPIPRVNNTKRHIKTLWIRFSDWNV